MRPETRVVYLSLETIQTGPVWEWALSRKPATWYEVSGDILVSGFGGDGPVMCSVVELGRGDFSIDFDIPTQV